MGGECDGPCVGGVAPTYGIPVGRPHAADVVSRVGDVAPTYSHTCQIYLTPYSHGK